MATAAPGSEQAAGRCAGPARRARRRRLALAAPPPAHPRIPTPTTRRPRRCKQAIDAGLALFQQDKFQEAIDMFNLALELPGNGAYRLQGSPREYRCAPLAVAGSRLGLPRAA